MPCLLQKLDQRFLIAITVANTLTIKAIIYNGSLSYSASVIIKTNIMLCFASYIIQIYLARDTYSYICMYRLANYVITLLGIMC